MEHERAVGARFKGDPVFQIKLEYLEVLVFEEGRKPENPDEAIVIQQTQPTYDVESGNRTWATLVGGECSHHCTIPPLHLHVFVCSLDSG